MTLRASAVALAAALLAAAPARAACSKDADCDPGKVCSLGKCIVKKAGGTSSGAGAPAPARATSADTSTSIGAVTATFRPSIAIFGLYSWGGIGLGGRLEWPLLENLVKEIPFKNDLLAVGGIEYYTESFDTFGGSYRVSAIRVEAGAMWNFWFAHNFAAYPKLTLGYEGAWLSNNVFGAGGGGGRIVLEAAAGVIYNLTPVFTLRGEIGNGAFKVGIGIRL
jgi:hypothetical protein